jgi:hypothetical protein
LNLTEDDAMTASGALGAKQGAAAPGHSAGWLPVLRRYFALVAIANLAWETAQLPLYTIWSEGTPRDIAIAALHCTAGDVLIAGASLLAALLVLGNGRWPSERYRVVAAATLVAGLGYTVFSEWLNTEIRGNWAYADIMPTLPVIGTGLAPFVQWIAVPLAAFWWARRSAVSTQPKELLS